ncbi:MAG: dihydroorotate dehydrogenase electron transfer subunit [Oscillospiraceae bacterium]|nr:dihydroorotate dehydrogenase electron transfer subunit [Oscillospiraceae bacterium]
MRCETVRLISNREIAPGIHELTVPCNLPVKAGQFFMLKSAEGAVLLPRAISACDCDGENLTMLVQNAGRGTAELCRLHPGGCVLLTGPLGNGFPLDIAGNTALVGGGIGIAPMLLTARRLRERGYPADCYLGYRGSPFYHNELGVHARRLCVSTDDGSMGYHGLVTDIFNPAGYSAVFCCGPLPMMRAVTKLCAAADIPIPVYISMETRMACGVGGCLVCACAAKDGKNLRACLDGPVFRGEDLNLES